MTLREIAIVLGIGALGPLAGAAVVFLAGAAALVLWRPIDWFLDRRLGVPRDQRTQILVVLIMAGIVWLTLSGPGREPY